MSDKNSIRLLFFMCFILSIGGIISNRRIENLENKQEILIEWVDQLNEHTGIRNQVDPQPSLGFSGSMYPATEE